MPEHNVVTNTLRSVVLGAPRSFANLTLFPLIAGEPRDAGYLTLDEALESGAVTIGEVSEQGSVPELSLMNNGSTPVLLLDGEELIGAKQNRVLNLTILVAAHSKLAIPVSCVEAGRWSRMSRHFSAAPRAQFAEGRAAKMRQVTESLRSHGTRRSDQGEVWRAIDMKASRLGASSDTSAMSAVFERVAHRVDDFVRAFEPVPNQVGAVFAVGGRIAGLELFDAPETWRKLGAKLVRSYAVDAIDRGVEHGTAAAADASAFITQVASTPLASFPAIGLGDDVRLASGVVNGAALAVDGRAVHVSAFAQPA